MRVTRLVLAAVLTLLVSAAAYAQGSFFTSLSGTVVDSSGGVIPGANVKIRNNGTGEEVNTISASDGGFSAPSLSGGVYTVTVTLMGFKTATLNAVTLSAAVPAQVKVSLQVGALEENVTVVGDSALVVQTQSPSIATNLTGTQITSLPLTSRNALDSLTSLPGFATSGTARNSSVNGLPRSAINITLDGMNIQDNYLKTTDGYFARLTPTLDSVEEVTVTTAGNTADATGQGSVQVKFVTKSGSNKWTGTAYEYFRHDALNAGQFAALRREIRESRMPAREMRQGGTVTRRIGLDDEWLAGMPATRRFVKDASLRALIHYAASYRGEPTFAVQTILADPSDGEPDPQTVLHSDTFHPTSKAWLFLDDVGEDDGPFAYVPGSHRLTPQRLAWEREQSLSAARSSDPMHSEGSFRATASDLAALALSPPVRMPVPANTLIVADTSGFHRRTPSSRPTRRVEIYATLRRTPFIPWTGGHLAALPPFAGRFARLETGLQGRLERLGLARSPWRPVGAIGAYEPARI